MGSQLISNYTYNNKEELLFNSIDTKNNYKFNKLFVSNLISFDNNNPYNLNTKISSLNNLSDLTPLTFFYKKDLLQNNNLYWKDFINSLELFQKNNSKLEILNPNELFFLKNQINLNKFFIENLLHNFNN